MLSSSLLTKVLIGVVVLIITSFLIVVPLTMNKKEISDKSTVTKITTSTTATTTIENKTITSTINASTTAYNNSVSSVPILTPGTPLLLIKKPRTTSNGYRYINWLYYAQGDNTTIHFAFRNDPAYLMADDVSVRDNGTELLVNGSFENGLTSWSGGYAAFCSSFLAITGNCYYADETGGDFSWLNQTFPTVIGHLLNISFWITWEGIGSGVIINVTISP